MSENQNHEYFMKQALIEASKALELGNWPIGSVIVLNGQIIARAHNRVYSNSDKTHHAEMLALRLAARELSTPNHDAILYTTYEPCPMCLGAALVNHVKTIVCGPDIDGSGALGMIPNLPVKFKKQKYHLNVIQDVLFSDCLAISLKGIPQNKIDEVMYKNVMNLQTERQMVT